MGLSMLRLARAIRGSQRCLQFLTRILQPTIREKQNWLTLDFPTAKAEDVAYHLAMGSRRVPDNDVRGTSEAWYRLQGALGL